MHDTVFDRPTAPMYQPVPDCRIVCHRGRQRRCGTALSFDIMLQRLPVKLRLIGYSCVIISERRLAHFHKSREIEISLQESSRRNLTRIVRENRIRSMPSFYARNIWHLFSAVDLITEYVAMYCHNLYMDSLEFRLLKVLKSHISIFGQQKICLLLVTVMM